MKGSKISIDADERSLVVLNILLASIICLGCLPGLAGPVRFQPSSLQAGEPPWYGYYNRTINPPEFKDIDQLVLWKVRTPAAMAPAGLYANAMGFQHGPRIGYRMTGRILTAAKLIFTTEAVQGIGRAHQPVLAYQSQTKSAQVLKPSGVGCAPSLRRGTFKSFEL